MKFDIDYMKRLLDEILEKNSPTFDLQDFSDFRSFTVLDLCEMDNDNDDYYYDEDLSEEDVENTKTLTEKFVFHMNILSDQNYIVSLSKKPGIGISRFAVKGLNSYPYDFLIVPIRLTKEGLDYALCLFSSLVIARMKEDFNDLEPAESLEMTLKLGFKMVDQQLYQTFSKLMDSSVPT